MKLHQSTRNILDRNISIFEPELQVEINKVIEILERFSPMSDFNYLTTKSNTELHRIAVSAQNASWAPIRNIVRIIAKIADLNPPDKITRINVQSMNCGCDYFEGNLIIDLADGETISGNYKWQWTAFPGNERSYDKFLTFPSISNIIKN